MAANLSDSAEKKILDHINLVTAWTPTTPLKVALYTAAPGEAGGGTEVTGGSYARTTVTFAAATSGAGSTTNDADVTFPTASASWGTVTHAAIFDSAGVPIMIWYGALATSKLVDINDVFKISTGNLTLTLS